MILASGGIGLQFFGIWVDERAAEPFYAIGALAIALGIGFVASAIVSYILSRRLGLLDQPQTPGS
jgi:hypothetical protein